MNIGSVRVEGLGAPIEAELHWSPRLRVARVDAPSVDLARIEGLLGSPWGLRGIGSLEAALDLTGEIATLGGHLRVTDGSASGIAPLNLDASFNLHSGQANAAFVLHSDELGGARLAAHGEVDSRGTLASALHTLTGTLAVSTERLPINRVCAALRCTGALGRFTAALHGATAAVRLDVSRTRTPAGEPDTSIRFGADAEDPLGRLASFGADSSIDVRPILATGKFPDDAPIAAQFALRSGVLSPSSRADSTWPISQERSECVGYARGTFAKPFIVIEAVGKGIHYVGLAARSPATFNLHWLATADVNGIASEVDVQSIEDHVLHGSLRIDAAPLDLMRPGAAWGADLNLEAQNFPLSFVPFFADHAARGAITGKVNIGAPPRLECRAI